jgi:hypothetical protein
MTTATVNLPAAIALMARSIGVRQAKDMLYVAETPSIRDDEDPEAVTAYIFPAGACASAILAIGEYLKARGIDIEPVLELVRGWNTQPSRWTTPAEQLRVLEDLTTDPYHVGVHLTYIERNLLEATFAMLRLAISNRPTTLSQSQQVLWNSYIDAGTLTGEKFVLDADTTESRSVDSDEPTAIQSKKEHRVAFITHAESEAREAVRLEQIDDIKATVAKIDANPIVPGEKFHGGDMYEGFYAGMVVGQTNDYVAIWSKMARRVAILPKARIKTEIETGAIVAMHAWGTSLLRVVELTATYGWLDAFDDFAVEFQRTRRDWRGDLAMAGLSSDGFVLNGNRQVSTWYRDDAEFVKYGGNTQDRQYWRDLNDS